MKDSFELGQPITSSLPGPESSRLHNKLGHLLVAGKPEDETQLPIVLAKGSGTWVSDADDNRYLDFNACLNLPFGHSALIPACSMLNSGNYMTPQRLGLLQDLSELFPHMSSFQFRSSGTEAVEAAIRYAKQHHGPDLTVVGIEGAYHGLTLAAQQVMGHANELATTILPFPVGVNNRLACTMLREIASRKPVLLVLETVQGATLRSLPESFLDFIADMKSLRGDAFLILCDDMLVSVRCGKWCSLAESMKPDLFVAGKSWSGGFPFSLVGIDVSMGASAGSIHGTTTYGGNPMSCEAAARTIQRLKSEGILLSICEKETYIRSEYVPQWLRASAVTRATCVGLLFGFAIQSVERAAQIGTTLLRNRILCARIGNVLRFSPPLNVPDVLLDDALRVITRCLKEA